MNATVLTREQLIRRQRAEAAAKKLQTGAIAAAAATVRVTGVAAGVAGVFVKALFTK